MLYDHRTKPESEWTFYVVDHLPTMKNFYRFDTVDEAIEKFRSIPEHQYSAIGASINGKAKLDLIHRRDGRPVLVKDFERSKNPVWQDGTIQAAIDKLIAYLNVQYELSNLFGNNYPSTCVELERYKDAGLENYFHNKLLRPAKPEYLLTAVNEVFVEGAGWMDIEAFLKKLDESRPQAMGEGAKANFVTRLNIMYIDNTGWCSQADISVKDFIRLKEKTERECAPDKLASDLYDFAVKADPYEAMDQADIKEGDLQKMRQDISSGHLSSYIQHLRDYLREDQLPSFTLDEAKALLARLTVLTPKEFRKRALVAMIQGAEQKANNQVQKDSSPRSSDRTL